MKIRTTGAAAAAAFDFCFTIFPHLLLVKLSPRSDHLEIVGAALLTGQMSFLSPN